MVCELLITTVLTCVIWTTYTGKWLYNGVSLTLFLVTAIIFIFNYKHKGQGSELTQSYYLVLVYVYAINQQGRYSRTTYEFLSAIVS